MEFIPVMKQMINQPEDIIKQIASKVLADLNMRVAQKKETARHIVETCREVFRHPYQMKGLSKNPHVIDFVKAIEWYFGYKLGLSAYQSVIPEFFQKYISPAEVRV